MPQNITLYKAGARDDDYAIDCVGRLSGPSGDLLKTLCLTWHPIAQGTIPTLVPGTNLANVPALRSASVLRSTNVYDGHLVVSQQIFTEIRSALQGNAVFLRVQIDGTQAFTLIGVNPFIVEDDPLQAIAQTLQATDEKVAQLVNHVATIAELLQTEFAARAAAKASSAQNGRSEYASAEGIARS